MTCDFGYARDDFSRRSWTLSGVDEFELRKLNGEATEVALWQADPTAPGPAILFEAKRMGLVTIDLSRDAIPFFVVKNGLPARDCCGSDRVLEGVGGRTGFGMASVIHRFRPGVVPRPALELTYPARRAASADLGGPVRIGGHDLDLLRSLGVLAHNGAAHVLWGDADGEPRGWERLRRMQIPVQPRLALQSAPLLVTPDGPAGFARPPGMVLVLETLSHVFSGLTRL